LKLDNEDTAALLKGSSLKLNDAAAERAELPRDIEMPILAVPAASRAHCYAVTLYGPHVSGTAIDRYEQDVLVSLGHHAADAYARLEADQLRKEVAMLQMQIRERGALA
jgi:hypothetical protein